MRQRIYLTIMIFSLMLNAEIIKKGFKGDYTYVKDGEQISLEQVDGTVKSYYDGNDSTSVHEELNFVKGKMDGNQKEYYRNGKIKAEYNMTSGIRTGKGKEYYDSGELEFERDLDETGTGLGIEYHKNGMRKRERLYKNNEQIHVSRLNHDIKGVKYNRTPEELFFEAQEYAFAGMYGHAIEDYKLFVKSFPDNEKVPNVKFLIAFTYHNNLNDLDNAKKEYEKFISQYPDSPLKVSAEFELKNIGKTIEEIEIFNEK